jgi:hypothetical protein
VAAQLRRELDTKVEMAHGRYGEFKVMVDGDTVIDGGAAAFLGLLPTRREVVDAVRARLSEIKRHTEIRADFKAPVRTETESKQKSEGEERESKK